MDATTTATTTTGFLNIPGLTPFAFGMYVGVACLVLLVLAAMCNNLLRLFPNYLTRTSQNGNAAPQRSESHQPVVNNRVYQSDPGRSNEEQAHMIPETDVKPRRNLDDNKKKQNITPILFTLPQHWNQGQLRVNLERDTAEFSRVYCKFHETCTTPGIKITEIVRIQNEYLYTQYQAQKNKVEKELANHPSIVVERELWHGTTAESVKQICANEFNRSFAGKNGMAFGQGTYFSTTSQYSLRYTAVEGAQYMILAKVVTGRYQLGTEQTQRKDLKQGCHSTVNKLSSPTIFVVYHDAAAYPEYVVKFW